MAYREPTPLPPHMCDVTTAADLRIVNGAVAEFAIPCLYVIPVEEDTVVPPNGSLADDGLTYTLPIQLVAEGYDPAKVLLGFDTQPAGLTWEAWIDPAVGSEHIIRFALSARCAGAVTEAIQCNVSLTITRSAAPHGDRTDIVLRGPLTILAAPLTSGMAGLLVDPSNVWTTTQNAVLGALGNGVIKPFTGLALSGTAPYQITLTSGTALINGVFFDVGATPIVSPTFSGQTRVILRYTYATNTITVAYLTLGLPITRDATVYELSIAKVTSGTNWTLVFEHEMIGFDPAGSYKSFAMTNVPIGWLAAEGQTLNRHTYRRLWDAIGYTYGGADDAFLLPDWRGRVGVSLKSTDTSFDTLTDTGGSKTVSLTEAQMPTHNHDSIVTAGGLSVAPTRASGVAGYPIQHVAGTFILGTDDLTTTNAGSGTAHDNMPPYAVEIVCIRT